MKRSLVSAFLLCSGIALGQPATRTIHIDASAFVGEMRPFWSFFGYDEPNFTATPNGQKLLSEIAKLSPVPVYVRTHNLLTSKGESSGPDLKWGFTDAYREDRKGRPAYNWTVIDSIVDTYIKRGMKPLMEIGFMPKDLSIKPTPYAHNWSNGGNLWTGWTYPPKDYNKWRELVFQWVKHSIDRYGKDEVTTWLWEVWNEPDIPYWSGTFDEYCKLYDFAADGLKRACPECAIGGPHTTSPRSEKAYKYLVSFIEHCIRGKNYATGKVGSPLDYIGFHAKGAPEFIEGHIRMNMGAQLKDIQRGFEAVNSFPELKGIPVVIGECDPEGCAACSEKRDPKYGYRNGTMYSSYTASSFSRIYELMDQYNINLRGVVSWSFQFEGQEWFAGFRDLATNGIDKPVLNVFRMFGMMSGQRITVRSDGALTALDIITKRTDSNDIHAMASKNERSVSILVWNYSDHDLPGSPSNIQLNVSGIPKGKLLMHHYRIDAKHSNSFEVWKAMGRPQNVTPEHYQVLERSGQLQLVASPEWIEVETGVLPISFEIPQQGVSLIQLQL